MKKTENQTKISKLDESIHILNVLNNNIASNFNSLFELGKNKIEGNVISSIHQIVFEYGLIQIKSYLDEYNKHFFKRHLNKEQKENISKYFNRIKKEIDRFPDIGSYRNNVLAHNLRKDDMSIYIYGSLRTYKVPQTIFEMRLLICCINFLTEIINKIFPNSYIEVQKAIENKIHQDKTPYLTSLSDIEVDIFIKNLHQDLNKL